VVSSFILFDGVVRVVSGANASDRKRQLYLTRAACAAHSSKAMA
jgi:hypothetical protein